MTALLILGGILSIVGGIWLLVVAFQTSVWWGLGSLLVPFVSLIFVIMHWQVSKKPFLISLAGTVLVLFAAWKSPQFAQAMQSTTV
jgi:uncharacterized membrane protein